MEAWQQQYDRMTGLLKVYRAEGAVQLKEALFDCYRKLICDIEDRQRKEKALREKIRQLEEGGLLNVPEDVQNFMDYIRTCHGVTCVYGAQYLQEAEETERCGLLERIPFLPYAVILKDGFSKVAADVLLKEKDFGEHAIPVLSLEVLLSEDEPADRNKVLFAGKGSSFYLDEKMRRKICAQSREQVEELEKSLKRMQDQLETAVFYWFMIVKRMNSRNFSGKIRKKNWYFWKNRRQSEGRCRN